MARFDVYRLEGELLLDVQSDMLIGMDTRLVVPLLPPVAAPRRIPRLNPTLQIGSDTLVMVPTLMGAVPTGALGRSITNLADQRDAIASALDMTFYGF